MKVLIWEAMVCRESLWLIATPVRALVRIWSKSPIPLLKITGLPKAKNSPFLLELRRRGHQDCPAYIVRFQNGLCSRFGDGSLSSERSLVLALSTLLEMT